MKGKSRAGRVKNPRTISHVRWAEALPTLSAESGLSGSDLLLVFSSGCPCSPLSPCATADALLYLGNSASFPPGKPCLLSQAGPGHLGPLVCSCVHPSGL